MPSLKTDIRQLFSETVLKDFERLAEAEIDFTFDHGDVYMSSFAEAIDRIATTGFIDYDPDLMAYAQVFERFVSHPMPVVDRLDAAITSSALYWLSGYSADAMVIARAIQLMGKEIGEQTSLLVRLLARDGIAEPNQEDGRIYAEFFEYLSSGSNAAIQTATRLSKEAEGKLLDSDHAGEYFSTYLLTRILGRLERTGFWGSVNGQSTAPREIWQRYMTLQIQSGSIPIDLWPSQRTAISKGLLDGQSSLVIRMPTSSGKTKMTELAFINDLSTYPDRRCLYLAPYRALVTEVEGSVGNTLADMGFPVASLYGGSEANELEVRLSETARVIIATPEKIEAVLRMSDRKLEEFETIVLDEGDLIDSMSRGARYEMQLAQLRAQLSKANRAIFLSAVLPEPEELASWLVGTSEGLADEDWQPTSLRLGVVTWPTQGNARLDYLIRTGQPFTDAFFVPRVFEEDLWKEVYPPTGQPRTYRFPDRGNKGSVAAAFAFSAARTGPVIIFSARRDWANSIARRIVDRLMLNRPVETNLVDDGNRVVLEQLSDYFGTVLGEDSILSQAIRFGVALHHGRIPQRLRLVIEDEYRQGNIRLLVATSTIAQGVNFPAKTVIVHSYPQTDSPIRDFWNLAGRAGRALRETEGEVIILDTGTPRPRRLRRFMNAGRMEPVQSRILHLAKVLVDNYLHVSMDTLESLLRDHEDADKLTDIVRAIDANLLGVIAEDANLGELDDGFLGLVENLYAIHQADKLNQGSDTDYRKAVEDLLRLRRDQVIQRVPEGAKRRKFSRTTISIDSALHLESSGEEILNILDASQELSLEALTAICYVMVGMTELSEHNPEELALLGHAWIVTGSYAELFGLIEGRFDSTDEIVGFVEQELTYRLPWLLNDLTRILERDENLIDPSQDRLPSWFTDLPQLLRYGVDTRELVWAMSLGLTDRRFAEWLLKLFDQDTGRSPASFIELVRWAIDNRDRLLVMCSQIWPLYFERSLGSILTRYSKIYDMLTDQ